MKHSTTPPFCGKHPGTTEKCTHTPGSSGHLLQRRRRPQSCSARPSPPSSSPRDPKTLDKPQNLAPRRNGDTSIPLKVHRPSHQPRRKRNGSATTSPQASSRKGNPSLVDREEDHKFHTEENTISFARENCYSPVKRHPVGHLGRGATHRMLAIACCSAGAHARVSATPATPIALAAAPPPATPPAPAAAPPHPPAQEKFTHGIQMMGITR